MCLRRPFEQRDVANGDLVETGLERFKLQQWAFDEHWFAIVAAVVAAASVCGRVCENKWDWRCVVWRRRWWWWWWGRFARELFFFFFFFFEGHGVEWWCVWCVWCCRCCMWNRSYFCT